MDSNRNAIFRTELKRKQSEIWEAHDSQRTAELFHFTSPQAFRGIIENHELWCTDVRYVNDEREGDHGMSIVQSVVRRKSVYKTLRNAVLNSSSLFGLKDNWTSYISCFCSAGEQMHMWQNYANGGTGCALVFDYRALCDDENGGKLYAFFRVLYDEQEQIRQVERTVDHAIQLERSLDISGRQRREAFWTEVVFALMTCAVRFKNPKWSREEEVRLWVAGGPDVTPFEAGGKPRVRVGIQTASLKRVVRGPSAGDNLSIERIERLLNEHNFGNVPVRESGTTVT